MINNDKLSDDFLRGIEKIEELFLNVGFKKVAFFKKGFAFYVEFKNNYSLVKINFGPADYQLDFSICKSNRVFEFKDLLKVPKISEWIDENRYIQIDCRNIVEELIWIFKLVVFSFDEI